MRMQKHPEAALRTEWHGAIRTLLDRTAWGLANPDALPREEDVEVAYWADLFKRPSFDEEAAATKGIDTAARDAYYAFCRACVRAADQLTDHAKDGRPDTPFALFLDDLIAQTATYMQNGPVFHPDPAAGDGAFFQVQARFRAKLKEDTRLVIGHSLGSVVAYEGLCWRPHRVSSFITVGSPMATPDLILTPLRRRLAALKGGPPSRSLPWPNQVVRWTNVYAGADVWCVPVDGLAHLFEGPVRDVRVEHGSTLEPSKTHELTAYLQHTALGDAVAEALQS